MPHRLPLLLRSTLAQAPLIAILRGLTPPEAPHVGRVLWEAGFRVLEVPLNSPEAFASIALLRAALPDALIGAGTVLDVASVAQVKAAGGQLVIAPNFNVAVVAAAKQAGMLAIPGVATPTEAFAALAASADAITFCCEGHASGVAERCTLDSCGRHGCGQYDGLWPGGCKWLWYRFVLIFTGQGKR
jgi:2-keto-3-deoxy-6-phosphogluconate aldolase